MGKTELLGSRSTVLSSDGGGREERTRGVGQVVDGPRHLKRK